MTATPYLHDSAPALAWPSSRAGPGAFFAFFLQSDAVAICLAEAARAALSAKCRGR
jgi:hypothetical protein